jgi:hypothetical protein
MHETGSGTNAKCRRTPLTSDGWGKADPMQDGEAQ